MKVDGRRSRMCAMCVMGPQAARRSRALLLLLLTLPMASTTTTTQPHLFFILADDLGWANVGWHRPANYSEVKTPMLDGLVREGVELERHYAFKFCSPSRSSLQSGRNPIHVNVNNFLPIMHNPADPVSGFSAIPRNMTGLASVMSRAGYNTVMAGKWDAGQATRP